MPTKCGGWAIGVSPLQTKNLKPKQIMIQKMILIACALILSTGIAHSQEQIYTGTWSGAISETRDMYQIVYENGSDVNTLISSTTYSGIGTLTLSLYVSPDLSNLYDADVSISGTSVFGQLDIYGLPYFGPQSAYGTVDYNPVKALETASFSVDYLALIPTGNYGGTIDTDNSAGSASIAIYGEGTNGLSGTEFVSFQTVPGTVLIGASGDGSFGWCRHSRKTSQEAMCLTPGRVMKSLESKD